MTILHDMIALYNALPEDNVYARVLAILLRELKEIPQLSLEQTAELCGVSTITISRLLKKIGCGSFRSFRQQIEDVVDGYPKYNRVIPIPMINAGQVTDGFFECLMNELGRLRNELDADAVAKACAMIREADEVHFCDMYANGHAKRQFQADLCMDGKKVRCHSTLDTGIRTTADGPAPVVLATVLSVVKNYGDMSRGLKQVHENGCRCIVIASASTPGRVAAYSDCLIRFHGIDSAADNIFIDCIYDVLCMNYRASYID